MGNKASRSKRGSLSSGAALGPKGGSSTRRKEEAASRAIDVASQKAFSDAQRVKKLLLLGAGESGKSTLFRQVIYLYGRGFSQADRAMMATTVFDNCIDAMQCLIYNSSRLQKQRYDTAVLPSHQDSARVILELPSSHNVIDFDIARHLKRLWKDPGIRLTWKLRSKFQIIDTADWFFSRLDALAQPDYVPDFDDVVRVRVRTTGIVETDFKISSNHYRLIDVGGQRNERKKWIHCFDSVTALIFVVAISAYDQVLFEDEQTNRIHEALKLFDDVCNSRWFANTSIILFLNKRDLFAEKITQVPLTVCFPEYRNNSAVSPFDSATSFIREVFESLNTNQQKKIYTHITCATDSNNIRFVFNAVKDIIIHSHLKDGGLY